MSDFGVGVGFGFGAFLFPFPPISLFFFYLPVFVVSTHILWGGIDDCHE